MKSNLQKQTVFHHIQMFFATTFYSGKIPGAPGTYSSLITCIIVYFTAQYGWMITVLLFSGITIIAFLFIRSLLPAFESSDPPELNIDEVVGQFAAFILIPISWVSLITGFALFRLFDIAKPFPVGYIDKNMKGAAGILLDDIAAGIMANLVLQFVFRILPMMGINTLI